MENKFIIYGAGKLGKRLYEFMKSIGMTDSIAGFCDANYSKIREIDGKKVYEYNKSSEMCKYPYYISIKDPVEKNKIEQRLYEDGKTILAFDDIPICINTDRTKFNRMYYAFIYRDCDYYDRAEVRTDADSLDYFWNEKSDVRQLFDKLDLENVIELACGHGRHVPQYIDKAKHITLVDINQENIDFCKQRFAEYDKVSYYCNNGYNLKDLKSDYYTALFSYAAMHQFQMLDICEYLKDIYRVVAPGGCVLIHHSNFHSDYKASNTTNPEVGGRTFMSKDLFANIAWTFGFEIVEQRLLDAAIPKLDCVSLIKKRDYEK